MRKMQDNKNHELMVIAINVGGIGEPAKCTINGNLRHFETVHGSLSLRYSNGATEIGRISYTIQMSHQDMIRRHLKMFDLVQRAITSIEAANKGGFDFPQATLEVTFNLMKLISDPYLATLQALKAAGLTIGEAVEQLPNAVITVVHDEQKEYSHFSEVGEETRYPLVSFNNWIKGWTSSQLLLFQLQGKTCVKNISSESLLKVVNRYRQSNPLLPNEAIKLFLSRIGHLYVEHVQPVSHQKCSHMRVSLVSSGQLLFHGGSGFMPALYTPYHLASVLGESFEAELRALNSLIWILKLEQPEPVAYSVMILSLLMGKGKVVLPLDLCLKMLTFLFQPGALTALQVDINTTGKLPALSPLRIDLTRSKGNIEYITYYADDKADPNEGEEKPCCLNF